MVVGAWQVREYSGPAYDWDGRPGIAIRDDIAFLWIIDSGTSYKKKSLSYKFREISRPSESRLFNDFDLTHEVCSSLRYATVEDTLSGRGLSQLWQAYGLSADDVRPHLPSDLQAFGREFDR